jgi:hypothetical protein
MADEGRKLVEKLLSVTSVSKEFREDQDRLDVLERQASFQQALSATGALQQIGLAVQCAERIDADRLPDDQRQ